MAVVQKRTGDAHPPLRYVFFDGASQNNPGSAAYGCVLRSLDGQDILLRDCESVGRTTNNEAEYCGFILGLHRAASEHFPAISIRGVSSVVVDQIAGVPAAKLEASLSSERT